MSDRHTLIAFCAILFAICYLATIAAVLVYQQRYAEALGFGSLTTGLVGIAGTFKPASRLGQNVEKADTVNRGAPP